MDLSMSSLLDRGRRHRHVVAGVCAATLGYVLIGGLSIVWALVGAAASVIWATLWPETNVPARPGGAQSHWLPGAEDGLATLRALPFSVLDGLADAALVLDARGLIAAANTAAQGLSPVLVGRPLSQWNRSPELLAATDHAKESGGQQRCHLRLFTPVERSLDVMVTPISDADSNVPPMLLIVLRDLTEQESLARMRVDFVANASHELRTPLASLRGFIETLQGAAKNDPPAQARFLGIMQAQAERMSRLIEDLLSLSRIEMREHVAPTGVVDLSSVVRDCATALKSVAQTAGIIIEAPVSGEPVQVTGDRDELMQVTQNLLQNALKYGRTGGHVAVSINRGAGQVVLEVADDGIGIASEHIPRLTERFYRVSAKDSKERGGTGLGLAIVKHIVNRHGGELRITSTLGKGSTFAVVLPAATPPP